MKLRGYLLIYAGLVVAGVLIGTWVYHQGFGALPALLFCLAMGSIVIGLVLRPIALLAARCFNFTVVLTMLTNAAHWYAQHNFRLLSELKKGVPVIFATLLLAAVMSYCALLPHRLQNVFSRFSALPGGVPKSRSKARREPDGG
jgi:hypothetical protein